MTADLISVIVPTYKGARYLPAALESLFQQTHKPLEIIVINDGSPDDTEAVLAPFMHRIVYRKQENQGTAAARNHGLRLAQGQWGALLDHDDVCMPNRLELQLQALQRRPDAIACFTGHWLFEGDRRIRDYRGNPESEKFDALTHLTRYLVWGPTVLFDRRRAEGLWFPEDVKRVDDLLFAVLLRLRGEFVVLPDLLYGSREWPGQTSKGGGRDAQGAGFFPRMDWLDKHRRELWPDKSFEQIEEVMWHGIALQLADHYWTRQRDYFRIDRQFILDHWPKRLPLPEQVYWRWYPDWMWNLKQWWDERRRPK